MYFDDHIVISSMWLALFGYRGRIQRSGSRAPFEAPISLLCAISIDKSTAIAFLHRGCGFNQCGFHCCLYSMYCMYGSCETVGVLGSDKHFEFLFPL